MAILHCIVNSVKCISKKQWQNCCFLSLPLHIYLLMIFIILYASQNAAFNNYNSFHKKQALIRIHQKIKTIKIWLSESGDENYCNSVAVILSCKVQVGLITVSFISMYHIFYTDFFLKKKKHEQKVKNKKSQV